MTRPPSTPEAFWAKVSKGDGCWEWTGAKTDGYGRVSFRGRADRAHRVAWLLTHGDPGDMAVLHRCDNPPCCKPDHLFLGTRAENMADMTAKGRARRNGRAKLSAGEAAEIRRLHAAGHGVMDLAREFAVDHKTIRSLLSRVTWR